MKIINIHLNSLKLISLWGLVILFILSSCSLPKHVAYFQDITYETIKQVQPPQQIKIESNDKLSITVKTMDPSVSSLFNLQVIGDRVGENEVLNVNSGNLRQPNTSSGLSKYTVSSKGTIDFPVLGTLMVKGMTREELAGFIKGELVAKDLAKDPIVTVEFVNLGVSLLGEINRPGLYAINQDEINILEAISMAGDLTINGKRENVSLVRETEDGIKTFRLDLTNFKELSQSPAYYLKQGDIIYIEPTDMRKRQTTTNGNNVLSTSFWISVASLLTSIVTTVGVFIVK